MTPAKIIGDMAAMVDELGLPHPLHLHCNNLGAPGNIDTTIETITVRQLLAMRGGLREYNDKDMLAWTQHPNEDCKTGCR